MPSEHSQSYNTPYDDAFKSIVRKCPRLSLPLINEMFFRSGLSDEEYTGREGITFLDKELPRPGSGSLEMDFRIEVSGKRKKRYHLECQSTPDGTIALRMIQYDLLTTLEEVSYLEPVSHARIDDSGVLFLRSTKGLPDVITVELSVPQNQTVTYQIPMLKIQDYTLEALLEKNLYILLPFLFFNFEKELGRAGADPAIFDEINGLYDEILTRMKENETTGAISSYEARTLYDALKLILEALGKTNRAQKEVEEIMGGRVLEFPADKYFQAGETKGRKEGREEGREEETIEGIQRAMKKLKLSLAGAMEFMDIPPEDQPRYTKLLESSGTDIYHCS